ncbi:GntR family transcriptional regulator [Fictibacillus sp. B-59209]|uniref:GntR family transcriptional regulator n=1 Tax=Fictibacillus sp. B-59209 TaxID=3024873 RepID=UPI002E249BAC|nr:GntR family transcriptional regulator [Fictibacillus sp. B-59209]
MREIKKTELLHSQVYHIVKTMVMEGEFRPGKRLVETKTAEKLGVSRGTVREAFRMLIKDGLLVQDEGMVFVYNPGPQDILDVYECRKSLESLAIRLAANNINKEQLDRLQLIVEESKEAVRMNNSEKLTTLNHEYHGIIVIASHNKQLIQLFDVINAKVLYIRNCILKNRFKSFEEFVEDHERIFSALKEGNPAEAEKEMLSHIEKSLEVANTSISI